MLFLRKNRKKKANEKKQEENVKVYLEKLESQNEIGYILT